MPNFNKSKGFNLRSGNSKGMPFKQMGSSPANYGGLTDIMKIGGGGKQDEIMNKAAAEVNKPVNTKVTTVVDESNNTKTPKTKVHTRGNERGQVKKAGRLDKIQNRQDKRALKKYNNSLSQGSQGEMGMEAFKKSDKYTNKTSAREERLTKEVGMTGEDYKANQNRKRQELGKGLEDFGAALGKSSYAGGSGSIGSNLADMKQQRQSQKSQDILDQTRTLNNDQKIRDFEKGLTEENKLDTSETTATTNGKDAVLDSTKNSAEKARDFYAVDTPTPTTFNRNQRLKFGK